MDLHPLYGKLEGKLSISSGERSEPRENARTSGKAARGGEKGELSFVSPPLTLESPLACGSGVTSCHSPKSRACSQAIVPLVKSSD